MTLYPYALYKTSELFEQHVSLDGDAKEALEAALEAAYDLGRAYLSPAELIQRRAASTQPARPGSRPRGRPRKSP